MKTILFRIILLTVTSLALFTIEIFAQDPSISILKNGKKIDPHDMSITKSDKITFQILNRNNQINYKISNLHFEVRTKQYQQIKSKEEAKRFHKVETKRTDIFELSPKIEINLRPYLSKYVSRIILKPLAVEQIENNQISKVNWITYGAEYEFWYYN